MTYIPASIRIADALALDELCSGRFTLRNPPRPFANFGGVVDPPEIIAARKKQDDEEKATLTCAVPGCDVTIGDRSRTKTCRDHYHCDYCQCLVCRRGW